MSLPTNSAALSAEEFAILKTRAAFQRLPGNKKHEKKKKKKKAAAAPTVDRQRATLIYTEVLNGDLTELRTLATPGAANGTWQFFACKLLKWIENGMTGKPPFKVFARGNSKLPFSAFSTLPIANCPGAGACKLFCYSLTAWRYPAPYFRQLMNTLLCRCDAGRAIIAKHFRTLKPGVLRLFVDGDFSSVSEIFFFMELIRTRPEIVTYGYSKSWAQLLSAHLKGISWPENYLLNLSSGSVHDHGARDAVAALPIARGEFIALPVDRVHIKNRSYQGPHKSGFAAYQKAVIAAAAAAGVGRVFVCRGKCGSCMPDGMHACGAARLKGVKIAIGVH